MTLEMIFQKVDQKVSFIPPTSTARNMINTSIKPVNTRAVRNVQIS